MSRGVKTLEALVADVRMETNRSPSRNFGQDEYAAIAALIRREQDRLYWDHNWPFLQISRNITIAAGQHFYNAPSDLNFERITAIYSLFGGDWLPLHRGIGATEYNVYSSEDDERADPIEKWDIKIDAVPVAPAAPAANTEQIEFWPLPSVAGTVRAEGFAKLAPFTDDDHVCTLDSTLLTLFSSGELLIRDGKADAGQAKLAAANRLYNKQKGAGDRRTPNNSFSMAGQDDYPRARQGAKIIIIGH